MKFIFKKNWFTFTIILTSLLLSLLELFFLNFYAVDSLTNQRAIFFYVEAIIGLTIYVGLFVVSLIFHKKTKWYDYAFVISFMIVYAYMAMKLPMENGVWKIAKLNYSMPGIIKVSFLNKHTNVITERYDAVYNFNYLISILYGLGIVVYLFFNRNQALTIENKKSNRYKPSFIIIVAGLTYSIVEIFFLSFFNKFSNPNVMASFYKFINGAMLIAACSLMVIFIVKHKNRWLIDFLVVAIYICIFAIAYFWALSPTSDTKIIYEYVFPGLQKCYAYFPNAVKKSYAFFNFNFLFSLVGLIGYSLYIWLKFYRKTANNIVKQS